MDNDLCDVDGRVAKFESESEWLRPFNPDLEENEAQERQSGQETDGAQEGHHNIDNGGEECEEESEEAEVVTETQNEVLTENR